MKINSTLLLLVLMGLVNPVWSLDLARTQSPTTVVWPLEQEQYIKTDLPVEAFKPLDNIDMTDELLVRMAASEEPLYRPKTYVSDYPDFAPFRAKINDDDYLYAIHPVKKIKEYQLTGERELEKDALQDLFLKLNRLGGLEKETVLDFLIQELLEDNPNRYRSVAQKRLAVSSYINGNFLDESHDYDDSGEW